jgi:2-aminoadipate transaminase
MVSYHDNPAGRTMSLQRKQQLLQVVARWSAGASHPIYVLEDAAYRELRFEGEDVPSMLALEGAEPLAVYLGTFSKSFSPGLRVGWGVLPAKLLEPVADLKTNIDFGSPHFNQNLLEVVLRLGLDGPHVQRLCDSYREKRDAMLGALEQHFRSLPGAHWQPPTGGLYVWLELPDWIDTGPDGPLFDAALQRGMLYVPGVYCFPESGEPPQTNAMRLSFGVQSCPRIRQGIQLLHEAVEDVRAQKP